MLVPILWITSGKGVKETGFFVLQRSNLLFRQHKLRKFEHVCFIFLVVHLNFGVSYAYCM